MYDKETKSKWNHSTGLCMKGPLVGKQLEILPARVTLWKRWKKNFPKSKVLTGRKRSGFMGKYQRENSDNYGLTVSKGMHSKLYPFRTLKKVKLVNDTFMKSPYLVVFDPTDVVGFAFRRKLDGKTYTFKPIKKKQDGALLMKDKQTGSIWKRMLGKCIEGKLKGKQLPPTVAVPWLINRWKSIYQKNGKVYRK